MSWARRGHAGPEVVRTGDRAPDFLPVLSRGRHRTPKQGACFMEMASTLAGEKWSDHPGCTHPVLGELARLVNDSSSDRHRSELAVRVPSVVGLNSGQEDDVRWSAGLAASIASYAVTRVPRPSQRALAAGLFTVQRVVEARGLVGVPGTEGIDAALAAVPHEARFVRRLSDGSAVTERVLRVRVAPAVARSAVHGLVDAEREDPDGPCAGCWRPRSRCAQRLRAADRQRAPRTDEPRRPAHARPGPRGAGSGDARAQPCPSGWRGANGHSSKEAHRPSASKVSTHRSRQRLPVP